MYEGCILRLSRGSEDGMYTYQVVKPDGSYVCPKRECNEASAKMLPIVFAGADFNFDIIEGEIVMHDSGEDLNATVESLTHNDDDERVSIFEGVLENNESTLEINATKLESGRDTEIRKAQRRTYEQNLAIQAAALKELNKSVEEETADGYIVGGSLEIDGEIRDKGFYFDPKMGCKAFVPGHCEELDHWGLDSLYHIPVPTPAQRARYEQAVAAGVPADQLPPSPEEIIGLCNRVVPLGASAPCEYKDMGRYRKIPVYDAAAKVRVFSKKLLPDNYNAFVKWTGVVSLIEQLDGMVAALMMTPSLKICFSERPGLTMGVTEDKLLIGLDFLLTSSLQELAFVLMHEARHLLFEHPTRRGYRNPTLWNLATDLIINKQLTDSFDVDVEDTAGGRLILRLKDGTEVLVSDGRPRPKFNQGGVYCNKIDVSSDTAERVYLCLETGTEDYDAARSAQQQSRGSGASGKTQDLGTVDIDADDVVKAQLGDKRGKGEMPESGAGGAGAGLDAELTDEQKAAFLEQAKKQFLQNGGRPQGSGSGSGSGGMSATMQMSTAAYLALTLRQYVAMLKNGMNCKGEKISLKDAETARRIMAPYMSLFGLRF